MSDVPIKGRLAKIDNVREHFHQKGLQCGEDVHPQLEEYLKRELDRIAERVKRSGRQRVQPYDLI